MARVATAEDAEAVTETLALAFHEDPVWSWAFPDTERRLEQHRAVWGLLVRAKIEEGSVWQAAGGEAAAVWVLPGRPELGPEDEERLEGLLRDSMGAGAARVLDTFEHFEAAHPHEREHHYLSLLGTHPDHRGSGIGMGLLAECLRRIDAEGAPAFLESSNPANDHRYERLGFRRCGEFELAEDGPTVTQMWREPS
jgi:ribosomal protein S18 acetylase RimI-like enzyme